MLQYTTTAITGGRHFPTAATCPVVMVLSRYFSGQTTATLEYLVRIRAKVKMCPFKIKHNIMKAYGDIARRIMRPVAFGPGSPVTPRGKYCLHPLIRKLSGPQGRSGRYAHTNLLSMKAIVALLLCGPNCSPDNIT
jgi:hypothetical protein